jgi:F0F1-type ATP synthase assembly protein I
MAQSTKKKKPVGAMIVMGIISIALYAALLLKQDLVNSTFAQGGLYALLPIITAFVFSYFHGSFTGHFWTVLGVEAAKKKKEVK